MNRHDSDEGVDGSTEHIPQILILEWRSIHGKMLHCVQWDESWATD